MEFKTLETVITFLLSILTLGVSAVFTIIISMQKKINSISEFVATQTNINLNRDSQLNNVTNSIFTLNGEIALIKSDNNSNFKVLTNTLAELNTAIKFITSNIDNVKSDITELFNKSNGIAEKANSIQNDFNVLRSEHEFIHDEIIKTHRLKK